MYAYHAGLKRSSGVAELVWLDGREGSAPGLPPPCSAFRSCLTPVCTVSLPLAERLRKSICARTVSSLQDAARSEPVRSLTSRAPTVLVRSLLRVMRACCARSATASCAERFRYMVPARIVLACRVPAGH